MTQQELVIQNEKLILLPEKGVIWERNKTLFVSDLHLGKAAAFRKLNVPIPHGTTNQDLESLSKIIVTYQIEQLVVLGDLLHAAQGRSNKMLEEFFIWRQKHPNLKITLVRGNHDLNAGDPPDRLNIDCVSEPHLITPFLCAHDLNSKSNYFAFQGHIHPKVFVGSKNFGGKYFPCFVLEKERLVLPSFGSFTGGFKMFLKPGTLFYPIIEGQIYALDSR